MMVVGQLLIRRHPFHGPKINAPQYDMRFFARTNVGLQRRLPIQFYGQVHHVSTFHQTIRRCISPPPGNIDAHRRTSPDDLITIHRHLWRLLIQKNLLGDTLTKKGESLLFISIGILLPTSKTSQLRAEHTIMNTSKQRRLFRNRQRFLEMMVGKCLRRIFQINLIEHTMLVVPCQHPPVLPAEALPLSGKAHQISLGRNLLSTHLPAPFP